MGEITAAIAGGWVQTLSPKTEPFDICPKTSHETPERKITTMTITLDPPKLKTHVSPNTILVRVRERAFTDNAPDVPSAHDSHSNFNSHENVNIPFPDPE